MKQFGAEHKNISHIFIIKLVMDEQIKTIKQVHEELKDSVFNLNRVLEELSIKSLYQQQDLQKSQITLNKVLNEIPQEERLISLQKSTSKERKDLRIAQYSGDYEIIRTAKENLSDLKADQRDIYFLLASLRLPQISKEYRATSESELQMLHSYEIYSQKKYKTKFSQRNTISESYFQKKMMQKEDGIQLSQRMIVPLQQNFLTEHDLLIHVNFYDSHNGKKQHEFVCLSSTKLSQLAHKFYCMIEELSDNKPGKLNFFQIGSNIFYEGSKGEIQAIINKAEAFDKLKYYLYEMKKVSISDLRVIFGHPYLYRHLGGCDHMIVFKQARLFQPANTFHDNIDKTQYPVTVFESKMKKKKCEACSEYFATLATVADPLKKGENLYLCQKCHEDLHFADTKIISYHHE